MTNRDITLVEEPKRSDEYLRLFKELKQSFISADKMVIKLYEQGKRDNLPNHIMRKDIEIALDGIVKERRLRELLPLELKRSYTISKDNDSAMSAELDNPYSKDLSHLDQSGIKVTNESQAKFDILKDAVGTLKKLGQKEYDKSNISHSKYAEFLTREQVAELRDDMDDASGAINNICETHKIATIENNINSDPFLSNDRDKDEKISLKPAPIPKSEQIRLLQQIWGKEMYAMSRAYKSMGDSLIKMNYISDDPKVSEKLISILLQEMMTFTSISLQVFNEFMDYWNKFKSKEKLTEEDKGIIRALLHAISHLAFKVKVVQ